MICAYWIVSVTSFVQGEEVLLNKLSLLFYRRYIDILSTFLLLIFFGNHLICHRNQNDTHTIIRHCPVDGKNEIKGKGLSTKGTNQQLLWRQIYVMKSRAMKAIYKQAGYTDGWRFVSIMQKCM